MATEVKAKEKEFWEKQGDKPLTKEDRAELQRIRRNVRKGNWNAKKYEQIALRLKPGVNDRLKEVSSETGMSIPQMVTAIASGEVVFVDKTRAEKLKNYANRQGLSSSDFLNSFIDTLN